MPECTAAAVTDVLARAGLIIAGTGYDDGYFAADLPGQCAGVYWKPSAAEFPLAGLVISVLAAAGYQVERVTEPAGEYLVVRAGDRPTEAAPS